MTLLEMQGMSVDPGETKGLISVLSVTGCFGASGISATGCFGASGASLTLCNNNNKKY